MDTFPFEPQESGESYRFWNEEEWEEYLIDNEAVVLQYQKVLHESPGQDWQDPVDLYYKIHHGIDLGEDAKRLNESARRLPTKNSNTTSNLTDDFEFEDADLPEEDQESNHEKARAELSGIPVFVMASRLADDAMTLLESIDSQTDEMESLRDDILHHITRVAEDVAGGHGLGYDNEAICGNIVKNRWAKDHAVHARRFLKKLTPHLSTPRQLTPLLDMCFSIEEELQDRIQDLRSKVWW